MQLSTSLLLRQFREDIVSEKLEVISIGDPEFELAETLISRHAFDRRLRTLDALQIAVAIGLRDQNLIDCFVSADKVLCEVAAAEGFMVLNPENS
jgi:predicted nucleic acid-binding protein